MRIIEVWCVTTKGAGKHVTKVGTGLVDEMCVDYRTTVVSPDGGGGKCVRKVATDLVDVAGEDY